MRYRPKSAKGIEINEEVASALGLLEQWEEWDGDQYESAFMEEFESLYDVTPERLVTFNDERGGEISGVEGFVDGVTYLLFDKNESGEEWDALLALFEEKDIALEEGSWSQLM
jgi:hypothetical protein